MARPPDLCPATHARSRVARTAARRWRGDWPTIYSRASCFVWQTCWDSREAALEMRELTAAQLSDSAGAASTCATVGHCVYPHAIPVTETQRHSAYSGCYALSTVLEESCWSSTTFNTASTVCCLRAAWIMEKDDFKYQLSFGEDVFGRPRWCDLVGTEKAVEYQRRRAVPIMLDRSGGPIQRNFVHVADLVSAIFCALDHPKARRQTFNICMDEPVDYGQLAAYLKVTRDLPGVPVTTDFHSTWLDNSKAKFLLGWRPKFDIVRLVDAAFEYVRAENDPRKVWYPG